MDDRVTAERQPAFGGGARPAGPALSGRLILGLIVMTVGALWTLDNVGIVESGPILRWWPVILVAVGVAKLTGIGTLRRPIWGGILMIAGVWLLADAKGYVSVSVFDLWPLALVAIGVGMLTRTIGVTRDRAGAEASGTSRVSMLAFMSGANRKVDSLEFRGGELTAVMGGIVLDMTAAKPVPEGAVLDLVVCWGGVELFVPDHWRIVNEATVIMGGLEDQSKTPPPDSRETLFVRGLVCMGGVEIKNRKR